MPTDFSLVYRYVHLLRCVEFYYSAMRGWAVSTRHDLRFFHELKDCMAYLEETKAIRKQDAAKITAGAMREAARLDDMYWNGNGRFSPAYSPERHHKIETRRR